VKSIFQLPTFSALPKWLACELIDVLPSVEEPNAYSDAGDSKHGFFERVSNLMRDPQAIPAVKAELEEVEPARPATLEEAIEIALSEAKPEHLAMLRAIPADSPVFRFDQVAAEVAFAFDLDTGEARELGRGLDRDYTGRKPTEIVGTIDRFGFIGDAGLYVGDYKGRAHNRPPSEDPQFLAAALAASRIHRDREWVEIEVLYIMDEIVAVKRERVSTMILDMFEQELLQRRARAEQNRLAIQADPLDVPEAEVAEHCSFCDRIRYCPAQGMLARAVLAEGSEEIQAIVKVGVTYIDEVSAPRLHAMIQRAEKVLEILKSARSSYARSHPFRLPDGRWYGVPPNAQTRELLDGREIQKALEEIVGPEAAKVAINVSSTFEGITSAARARLKEIHGLKAPRGALGALDEQIQGELMNRGLMRVIQGGKICAHKREEK
jgi:hypothetical protein